MSHKEEKNFCKSLLIIQPGAHGDIFVCAPIAYYYSQKGFKIYWPARKEYIRHLSSFDYINTIELPEIKETGPEWLAKDVSNIFKLEQKFDYVLNLADRGPHPTAQLPWENFEECKYRLAKLPFDLKHTLKWTRNKQKEDEIYDKYVKAKDYVFVHNSSSHKEKAELPKSILEPIVYCDNPPGYNILDWYKVIINAKEIYCTESSVWAFMDGIVHELTPERYILSRQKLSGGKHYTISKHWKKEYLK